MTAPAKAYPLTWPEGFERTQPHKRRHQRMAALSLQQLDRWGLDVALEQTAFDAPAKEEQ